MKCRHHSSSEFTLQIQRSQQRSNHQHFRIHPVVQLAPGQIGKLDPIKPVAVSQITHMNIVTSYHVKPVTQHTLPDAPSSAVQTMSSSHMHRTIIDSKPKDSLLLNPVSFIPIATFTNGYQRQKRQR